MYDPDDRNPDLRRLAQPTPTSWRPSTSENGSAPAGEDRRALIEGSGGPTSAGPPWGRSNEEPYGERPSLRTSSPSRAPDRWNGAGSPGASSYASSEDDRARARQGTRRYGTDGLESDATSPESHTPDRYGSDRSASEWFDPERLRFDATSPESHTPDRYGSDRSASEWFDPERLRADPTSPESHIPDPYGSNRPSADRYTPEQYGSDRPASEAVAPGSVSATGGYRSDWYGSDRYGSGRSDTDHDTLARPGPEIRTDNADPYATPVPALPPSATVEGREQPSAPDESRSEEPRRPVHDGTQVYGLAHLAARQPENGPVMAPAAPRDLRAEDGQVMTTAVPRPFRPTKGAMLLHVAAPVLMFIALSAPYQGMPVWKRALAWSLMAALASVTQAAPVLPASPAKAGRRWRTATVSVSALVAYWILLVRPIVTSDVGFLLTLAIVVAAGAWWLDRGERARHDLGGIGSPA